MFFLYPITTQSKEGRILQNDTKNGGTKHSGLFIFITVVEVKAETKGNALVIYVLCLL